MIAHNYYQVGGSLKYGHPAYVERQADQDLYEGLKNREFCYVLNSRQMGKSSLRVQAMKTLSREGIKCASVDIGKLGNSTTIDKWYGGFISELWRGFGLLTEVNEYDWWHRHEHLSPILRISRFIEDILLIKFSENIVIFIDEIDSILKVSFKDDFFTLIRTCYNQRVDCPEYERLTFCLLGVATPSSLIQDKTRTPFNIGRAIELTGFTLNEAKLSLVKGLEEAVENPESVLEEVLKWTGGQPFLTQKLCQLIVKKTDSKIPNIQQLVQKYIISNWETQDEPEHLRTIRDRLLSNEQRAARLLGFYQQILLHGEVISDGSSEQMELRLSGLVVKQQSSLKIYNRIYTCVFDQKWLDKALVDLRPYSEAFTAWLASHCQDESRLLRGQALWDAQAWAADQSLSNLDYQFLTASLELDKREVQTALETEKQASQILSEANLTLMTAQKKALLIIRSGFTVLFIIVVAAVVLMGWADIRLRKAEHERKLVEVAKLNALSTFDLISNNQLAALVNSVKASSQLLDIEAPPDIKSQTAKQLKQVLDEVQEHNRLENHDAVIFSVNFSPDGKTLASASGDNTIKLWRQDGQLLNTLKGHGAYVYSVNFSPDGQLLASASGDNTIKLWRQDGHKLKTLSGHGASVYSLSFSPKERLLASASGDKTVKLWNLESDSLPITLKGHKKRVMSVSFSPDGKTLASASEDGTIKLWSKDGQLLNTLENHNEAVLCVSFSPDGKTIASASLDKTVKLWSKNGQLLNTLEGHGSGVYSVNFSPDGKTLASASGDRTIKLWNSNNGSELVTFKGHIDGVQSVSFSPDGKTLASASADNTVKLWSSKHTLLTTLKSHQKRVMNVSFSPDGKNLASASVDNTVKIWSSDGRLLRTLNRHPDKIYSVSFSPDGKIIASASADKTIKLWSLDGKELKTLKGHSDAVQSVSFSPDGKIIASASADKTIKLWNLDGRELKTLRGHGATVYSVTFSPDGKIIATASEDKTIKLWNLDGRELKTLRGHILGVASVSFSPDGKTIASASNDKTIKLWNLDGKELKTLTEHKQRVFSVSFSPDGKTIASASNDRTIKLWSLDGKELKTLKGHNLGISSVSFSPDSKIVASSSFDKTIKLWSLDGLEPQALNMDQLTERSCIWLHDYLKTNTRFRETSEYHLCNHTRKTSL